MASQATSSASSFTIEELTGDKRRVELRGRALPYRPLRFSGKQGHELTWYQGNPEGTFQMLGAREMPTIARGVWKNRFLGAAVVSSDPTIDGDASADQSAIVLLNGQPVTDTGDVVALFDDMRRKGPLIEVRWDTIVRRGIISSFDHEWDRHQDVSWECEFTWNSQGEPTQPAVTSSQADLSALNSQWSGVLSVLDDAQANSPFAQLDDFNAALTDGINTIVTAVFEIQDAASTAIAAVTMPSSAVKRLAGVMVTIQDAAQSLIDEVTDAPAVTLFDLGIAADQVTFGQTLSLNVYLRGLYDAARQALALAAQHLWQLQQQISPSILATYVARDGDDLRDVSTMFYETPNEWKFLMVFNSKTDSACLPGEVLFIPPSQADNLSL